MSAPLSPGGPPANSTERLQDRYNLPLLGGLVAAFAVTWFFWDYPFFFPFKMLVVLLHELSHGLAALATGGSIDRIELSTNQGGVCWTLGGWRAVVLMAGYLGSMLWGGLILLVASRTRLDRALAIALGLGLVATAIAWVQGVFAFWFTLGAGVAFVAMGALLKREITDAVLKYVGLVSCLYAVLDIWDDTISRNLAESDASQFGQVMGFGGSTFWGVVWIVLALLFGQWVLRKAVRRPKPPAPVPPRG
jgi:hypothetical protein